MVVHKQKMFTAGWSQVINLLFDEVMEHWDEEMWVRINGEKPDWKFINMDDFKRVPQMIPNALHGVLDGEEPIKQLTDDDGTGMTRDAKFDFTLNMGNGLPNDKMAMLQMFTEFAKVAFPDGPAITRKEFREFLRENLGIDLEDDQAPMMGQPPMGAPPMPQGMPPAPPPEMQQAPAQPMPEMIGGM